MESYSHLSPHERIRIEKLRFERRLTIRGIAAMIGRSPSTVSRETKRGLWLASNENESHRPYKPKRLKTGPWTAGPSYSALAAQRKAEQRAGRSHRPMRMDSDRLRAWVLNALRRGWTPQLIDGGPKAGFPTTRRCASATCASTSGSAPRGSGPWTSDSTRRAAWVRPLRIRHRHRIGPVETVPRHAGRAQEPQAVRQIHQGQGRPGDRAPNTTSTGTSLPRCASTAPGTTVRNHPATRSWMRTCRPSSRRSTTPR